MPAELSQFSPKKYQPVLDFSPNKNREFLPSINEEILPGMNNGKSSYNHKITMNTPLGDLDSERLETMGNDDEGDETDRVEDWTRIATAHKYRTDASIVHEELSRGDLTPSEKCSWSDDSQHVHENFASESEEWEDPNPSFRLVPKVQGKFFIGLKVSASE
jgi:hypothetical protein